MMPNRKETHSDYQSAFYQDNANKYEQLYSSRNRTYELKAEFAKCVIEKKNLTNANLLEVGCGTGLFTEKLADQLPNLNIHATDAYENMIQVSRQRLEKYSNVQVDIYDVSIPKSFDKEFDIVSGVDIIHHIEDPVNAFSAWHELTTPDGILLFLESNPLNPVMYLRHINRPEEKRLYLNNKKNLTNWLKKGGWNNVYVDNLPTYLPAGPSSLSKQLTKAERLIHKIPLIKKISGLFLVYAEK